MSHLGPQALDTSLRKAEGPVSCLVLGPVACGTLIGEEGPQANVDPHVPTRWIRRCSLVASAKPTAPCHSQGRPGRASDGWWADKVPDSRDQPLPSPAGTWAPGFLLTGLVVQPSREASPENRGRRAQVLRGSYPGNRLCPPKRAAPLCSRLARSTSTNVGNLRIPLPIPSKCGSLEKGDRSQWGWGGKTGPYSDGSAYAHRCCLWQMTNSPEGKETGGGKGDRRANGHWVLE